MAMRSRRAGLKRGRETQIRQSSQLDSQDSRSPPVALVEKVVHQLRCRCVEARRLLEVGQARFGDVLGRAEGEEQRALARRPDARNFVERALDQLLLAP